MHGEKSITPPQKPREQKIHPFLFLLGLAAVLVFCVYFWTDWQKKSEAKRLEEIVQSQDIAQLITGNGYNKKEFSEDLERLKKIHSKEYNLEENIAQTVQAFAEIPDFEDDDVGLAIKGITVSSGENGLEKWQLTAQWATMRQKTAVLQVENPVMRHRISQSTVLFENSSQNSAVLLENDPDKVVIEAKHGLVYDNNTKVLLRQDVLAKQNENYIQGPVLSYNSKEQLAVFPQQANFAGNSLKGNADVLTWNMQENKILGSGKVQVEWTPEQTGKQ